MNSDADQEHATRPAQIHKPTPFVIEKKDTFQIKIVLFAVMIMAVAWVGVLIFLALEIFRRM